MDGRAGRMRLVAEAVFCGLAAAFSPLHQGFERLPGDGRQAADWWCGMIALPLDAADLDRLGKFLGLLGSDHMGERAAAALKADSLVKNAGANWQDGERVGSGKRVSVRVDTGCRR